MTLHLLVLAMGIALDRLIGDPDWLWRKFTHPVVFFGRAIGWFDKTLNRKRYSDHARRLAGAATILSLLVASLLFGLAIHRLFLLLGPVGWLPEAITVAVFLAHKSLSDHVLQVAKGLRQEGLIGGRKAVSMIVGRDPETLDEPAVCRAAIESLAENFSDGVVAPAFWYVLLGLPGLFAYKMLNTADSMIGHKSPKYLAFGWASARLDDFANLPAARLSAVLIAAGAWWRFDRIRAKNALETALRDHGLHRSPNSGWPEAAMAGALDIQLAGPRIYGGAVVDEPMLNGAGSPAATLIDIEDGVRVFDGAGLALLALVIVCAVVAAAF